MKKTHTFTVHAENGETWMSADEDFARRIGAVEGLSSKSKVGHGKVFFAYGNDTRNLLDKARGGGHLYTIGSATKPLGHLISDLPEACPDEERTKGHSMKVFGYDVVLVEESSGFLETRVNVSGEWVGGCRIASAGSTEEVKNAVAEAVIEHAKGRDVRSMKNKDGLMEAIVHMERALSPDGVSDNDLQSDTEGEPEGSLEDNSSECAINDEDEKGPEEDAGNDTDKNDEIASPGDSGEEVVSFSVPPKTSPSEIILKENYNGRFTSDVLIENGMAICTNGKAMSFSKLDDCKGSGPEIVPADALKGGHKAKKVSGEGEWERISLRNRREIFERKDDSPFPKWRAVVAGTEEDPECLCLSIDANLLRSLSAAISDDGSVTLILGRYSEDRSCSVPVIGKDGSVGIIMPNGSREETSINSYHSGKVKEWNEFVKENGKY